MGLWTHPAVIARNHFQYKSLSDWSFNTAVGCAHGCRFCYVPSVSTIKQGEKLSEFGIEDADGEWGNYVLLRRWDEAEFLRSLRAAERTPARELSADGNRAVMFSTTTDPYQVIPHPDPSKARELTQAGQRMVRRALELIRDHSSINVRILTRSPLAKADFDLFRSFGSRLLFGMSLPTLRNDLAKVYEPKAPAPSRRLDTLQAARASGIHVYVAMAPTYPECDEDDIRATMTAIAALEPVTIFHEPINIRAENVQRISTHARTLGIQLKTSVFETRDSWRTYALDSLRTVTRVARELKVSNRLHLWPDKALGTKEVISARANPDKYQTWLEKCWNKVSAWPQGAALPRSVAVAGGR